MDNDEIYELPDKSAQQFAEMQQQLDVFLNGVRSALGVPDEYQLDAQRVAFVPPEEDSDQ